MLPILVMLFFFMALDRTNIAGVLTSTFLKDTGMTRDDVSPPSRFSSFQFLIDPTFPPSSSRPTRVPPSYGSVSFCSRSRQTCVVLSSPVAVVDFLRPTSLRTQIILQRIGAHIWIPAQVIVWGLAEILHMFIKTKSSFLAARFFLGRTSFTRPSFLLSSLFVLSLLSPTTAPPYPLLFRSRPSFSFLSR